MTTLPLGFLALAALTSGGGIAIAIVVGAVMLILFVMMMVFVSCFQKPEQGTAIIKTGIGAEPTVKFTGVLVVPVLHRKEIVDISVKRVEIHRHGSEGLVCKDNIRADIKVCFFVRINNSADDVKKVAGSLGCVRASDPQAIVELFDAKFSEALKTVGKRFDFTELYTERDQFKGEILKVIGTDLNGYVLDDAAIDYLEQTPLDKLDPRNILDAEGIKRITEVTAKEAIQANEIQREKDKTIKKQDVAAREAILVLERQQAEAEAKQKREITESQAREGAAAEKTTQEERLKAEKARIATEEELGIQEENKQRQIIVAERSKQRTDGVEKERVMRDQQIEQNERERLVTLAQIEKEKAVEVEKKKIQDVIRERVAVERTVVEEQQRIKDTEAFAGVERERKVQVTAAQAKAEAGLVAEVKAAEAAKDAEKHFADQLLLKAEAERQAAEKQALAKIRLAEATRAETAAPGLAEAEVIAAQAASTQAMGAAEAVVIRQKGEAEAAGKLALADAVKAHGLAEAESVKAKGIADAEGLRARGDADAEGVSKKADAMKKLDGVGKEHEEFKLRLNKELQVDLAEIHTRTAVVSEQAKILGEALKSAKIEIIGGETQLFNQLVGATAQAKRVDRLVEGSSTLSDVKNAFFAEGGAGFQAKVQELIGRFGVSSEDLKNLTVATLLGKLIAKSDGAVQDELIALLGSAKSAGVAGEKAGAVLGQLQKA